PRAQSRGSPPCRRKSLGPRFETASTPAPAPPAIPPTPDPCWLFLRVQSPPAPARSRQTSPAATVLCAACALQPSPLRRSHPRLFERHLQIGVFHQLRRLHHRLHRKYLNRARLFVELPAQVLLALQVLARGHSDGILHRAHYDLRINALFPAQSFNLLIKLARHNCLHSVLKTAFSF